MAKISGKFGKLFLGAAQVHIKKWTLEDMVDLPDATDSESAQEKQHVVGLHSWSFTAEAFYRDDTGSPLPTLAPGVQGTIKLYLDATHFYTGPCSIKSANPAVDVGAGGTVEYNLAGEGNGTLTRPA